MILLNTVLFKKYMICTISLIFIVVGTSIVSFLSTISYAQAQGAKTKGAQTKGSQTESAQTKGSQTKVVQIKGSQAQSSKTKGTQAQGSQIKGAQTQGIKSVQTQSAQGTQTQGIKSDQTQGAQDVQGTQTQDNGQLQEEQKKLLNRIDFGNSYILGQSIKSGAVYLLQRKKNEIHSMLSFRKDYRKEILEDFHITEKNTDDDTDPKSEGEGTLNVKETKK